MLALTLIFHLSCTTPFLLPLRYAKNPIQRDGSCNVERDIYPQERKVPPPRMPVCVDAF
jgi:hypothetical protein